MKNSKEEETFIVHIPKKHKEGCPQCSGNLEEEYERYKKYQSGEKLEKYDKYIVALKNKFGEEAWPICIGCASVNQEICEMCKILIYCGDGGYYLGPYFKSSLMGCNDSWELFSDDIDKAKFYCDECYEIALKNGAKKAKSSNKKQKK